MRSEKPKNIEEAVLIVLSEMSSEQEKHLKQISEDDLINEHFGFSLWVRNLLGHWVPPTPEGEGYNPAHPDDISEKITEIVWKKLQDVE
jgi:hypothetical protein